MSNNVIMIDKSKCVGCNNCLRVCPVHKANSAIKVNGENFISINEEYCIHCGSCIKACAHGARYFKDDIERLMDALNEGRRISLVIAPAFRTNFPGRWRKIISFFKEKGVNKIYDTSFGAEITTWAYLKYITENDFKGLIAQPCPAIVNYIQKYEPKLLAKLSPVHSPMGCTAVFMHDYAGIMDEIAYISPCIAKFDEVNHVGTPDYLQFSVTFKHLEEYIENHNIKLDTYEDGEFDDMGYGLGSIYPRPGGLKENVEVFVKDAWIHQCEGPHKVYDYLSNYRKRVDEGKELPILLDVLNCESGCNIGSATTLSGEEKIDDVDCIMNKERANLNKQMTGFGKKTHKLMKYFDENLDYTRFMRTYKDESYTEKEVSEMDISDTFRKMKKNSFKEQHFDCTACGYKSCREMARAIAEGNNSPDNCVRYKKMVLEELHEKMANDSRELIDVVNEQKTTNERIFNELSGFTGDIKQELQRTIDESSRIANIADEIGIVAFNAGIEAARIGSEGNGFNTVADEVRNLANESKEVVKINDKNNSGLLDMIDGIVARNDKLRGEMDDLNGKLVELINRQEKNIEEEDAE